MLEFLSNILFGANRFLVYKIPENILLNEIFPIFSPSTMSLPDAINNLKNIS